jgi:transglutaminase-like putative cysteine protease
MVALSMSLGCCTAGMAASSSHAQSEVLHEFVATVDEADVQRVVGDDDSAGFDDTLEAASIASPDDGLGADAPGQRSLSFRPDRQTALEGSVGYREVFDPAIAPFKRMSTLDRVRLDSDGFTPLLSVAVEARKPVPIEGARAAPDARGRDRFEASVILDFSAGAAVPLPSVSPESRILDLSTEPAIELRIERDGADNFYAVAVGALPAQPVRLSFSTDAPRSYFGGVIPRVPLAPAPATFDPRLRTRALRVAAELGIGPRSDLASALSLLTAHFRSFQESKTPPADSGDIYLDLARGKKGICRHRAYAFVITAQALGIVARFVQNEAHAWVEVAIPGVGFRRIDLGGAPSGLRTSGMRDRARHQASEPDRLPRPDEYVRSEAQAARTPRGSPAEAAARGRWVADAEAPLTPSLLPLLEAARESSERRAPLVLRVEHVDSRVRRGQPLTVRGRVLDAEAGAPVSRLRVEVVLSAEQRREHMLLGVTLSDAQGVFRGTFDVPPEVDVGAYRLRVVTPGDERYLPAVAD